MKMIKLLFITFACALVVASGASAWVWPGTFVAATPDNTVAAIGGNWYASIYGDDNLWSPHVETGLDCLYSVGSWHENTPMIKTTVNGLTASSTYEVYVVYNKGYDGSGLNIVAGLDPGAMTWFTAATGTFRAAEGTAVFADSLGSVTGVTSVSMYVDDGDNSFGQGSLYAGMVLAETPAVPEPSSILALASGFVGACGFILRRRNS